jgi:hypothetical protein
MKLFLRTLSILFIFNSIIFSQAGSVELRTGGGTLVNTFASIQAAYDAIPNPITQSYVIEILPAYNQSAEVIPITLLQKDSASSTRTITIRPAAGNSGEQISANSTSGIIVLNGADYVIIDGRPGGVGSSPNFKIENLATTGTNSNTILFQNGATNNIVRYVHVVNNTQNTAGPRAIMFGTGDACSFNTISNNRIQGGRSGIGIAGTNTTPCDKIVIRSNEIFDWGYAGIWLVSGALNTDIDSNRIYQTVGVNNTIVSGIIMSTIAGAEYNIRRNWIYDLRTTSTSTSSLRGIYAAGPAAGSVINVSNNMVSNTIDNGTAGQTVTGIEFLGSNAYTLNLYYNTVLIGGTHTGGTAGATTSAGIRIGATNLTLNMKNNIAINKRTGGNVNHIGFALVSTTIPTNLDINYNCYFANGTNSFAAWWGTTGYNTLSTYKTAVAPQEQNTIFKDVSFNSITNLHLVAPSDGDPDLAGTRIVGILTDFDGQVRDTVNPYRGADEATTIPVELASFNALVDGNNVTLNWTTATETNNYGFEVLRKLSNNEWEKIGFILGAGNSVSYNTYSYSDNNLTPGIYSYRLKQIDYSGAYKFYDLTETVNIGLPDRFELMQNFPNPFNPSTKIQYALSSKQNVSIKVFDILGNQVATLVNEVKEPGYHTVEFDGSNFSSGIYYYQMITEDFVSVKKMVLIK